MKLSSLEYGSKFKKSKTIVGRGIGSGIGKTCGSGIKGQKARSGVAINAFEGGQMPISMRLPKRGFNNPNKVIYKSINLGNIDKLITEKKIKSTKITKLDLINLGILSKHSRLVKLLASGAVTNKFDIEVDKCSVKAKEKLEAMGGKIIFA